MSTVYECIDAAKELIGMRMRNELSIKAPWDTGNLSTKIKYDVEGENIVFSMPIYGLYVEYGTDPHIIRPKNKKALAFAKSGGQRVKHNDGTVSTKLSYGGKTVMTDAVIVKEVHHPGTTPQPFVRPAFHQKLLDIVTNSLVECLQEITI